jgi:hypothetical protein
VGDGVDGAGAEGGVTVPVLGAVGVVVVGVGELTGDVLVEGLAGGITPETWILPEPEG